MHSDKGWEGYLFSVNNFPMTIFRRFQINPPMSRVICITGAQEKPISVVSTIRAQKYRLHWVYINSNSSFFCILSTARTFLLFKILWNWWWINWMRVRWCVCFLYTILLSTIDPRWPRKILSVWWRSLYFRSRTIVRDVGNILSNGLTRILKNWNNDWNERLSDKEILKIHNFIAEQETFEQKWDGTW